MSRMARPAHGFTLLELLVVMALLSGVMLALGSAMRTMARTEERIDQRLNRADEFRVATGFIRSTLGRVSARNALPAPQPGARPWLFAAEASSIAWVGVMPARYGAGGRYFFRLGVEQLDGGPTLAIRFMPWTDSSEFPDWSQAEVRPLVGKVRSFSISYENSRENPPQWASEWPFNDRLPGRVSLTLESESGAWPDLVVPLRILPGSENYRGAAVFGGGGN